MKKYVVGFLFTVDWRVVLIRKTKPAWQAGALNGIGGKIEPGETPKKAMIREFQEETGLRVTAWKKLLTLKDGDAQIHFFTSFSDELDPNVQTTTDETVEVHPLWDLLRGEEMLITNLNWILPLALHDTHDTRYRPFTITVAQK